MLQYVASRIQATSPALRGASAPAASPAKKPVKKPVTPSKPKQPVKQPQTPLGQDQLQLSGKTPVQKPVTPPPPPPETPVVANAAEAVALALKGEPVRVPVAIGPARSLAMKPAGVMESTAVYQVEFGFTKVSVSLPADQAPEAALARMLNMLVHAPEYVRAAIQSVSVERPGTETEALSVVTQDDAGKPVTTTLKRTGMDGALAVYELSQADRTVAVRLDVEDDMAAELARTGWLVAQVPARHVKTLKTVIIHNGPNPQDEYWAKTYNWPGFSSGATASMGVIHFWNGNRNMSDDTFHHEFGHLLGQRLSKDNGYVPEGWEDAIKADAKAPTSYSGASPTEDFAESWAMFMRVKAGKPAYEAGAKTEAEFVEKYPARAKLLQSILDSDIVEATAKSGGASRTPLKKLMCRGCANH